MHIIMITYDNLVLPVGSNHMGQTDLPKWVQGKTVDASCGYDFTLIKMKDNSICGFGNNRSKQIELPYKPFKSKIIQMASGMAHSVILTADKNIYVYGSNELKQISIPDEIANSGKIDAVYAGGANTIIKIKDDKLGHKLIG